MELVSMLFALLFLALFVIGSLIAEYFYEIRYALHRSFQKVSAFTRFHRHSFDD